MSLEEAGVQITLEDVQQHSAEVQQYLDVKAIVPYLMQKNLLSHDVVQRTQSEKYTNVEHASFLLNHLLQAGEDSIEGFIQCLRESSADIIGHASILQILEGAARKAHSRPPLFDILDQHIKDIVDNISLLPLLKSLVTMEAIPVSIYLDLQTTDRTPQETLDILLPVLASQGNQGFIKFISCLQKDLPNASHEKLSEILFRAVHGFFKSHPERENVKHSDRIELLQLENRDRVIGLQVRERLVQHHKELCRLLNVPEVFPLLVKTQVITMGDAEIINKVEPTDKPVALLDVMKNKEFGQLVKFVDCLNESPANKPAALLLLPISNPTEIKRTKKVETVHASYEKLAVFIYATHYHAPNGSPMSLEQELFDKPIKEHRKTLESQLKALDFHVVTLDTSVDSEDYAEWTQKGQTSRFVNEKFCKEVKPICREDSVVFIFLSGVQYPSKFQGIEYSGAILRNNASKSGRLPLDSIQSSDLALWVREVLPETAHVTFLVDAEISHVVAYDKFQQVSQVEILEQPWNKLVDRESNTVVMYLEPDEDALSSHRGQETRSPLGLLTETFNKALITCVLKNKEPVSHRSLFDALSFYWHSCQSPPLHPLYKPAIAGDMDRCFLGRTTIPYQQAFRADLMRGKTKGSKTEPGTRIKVSTGTMAGLIQSDHLEVFHVLRPAVMVKAQVTEAYNLHSVALVEPEAWKILASVLEELQQDGLWSEDNEFVLARKKFPLHHQLAVHPRELARGETNMLKTYIKEHSNLLRYTPSEKEAKVIVCQEEQQFMLKDIDNDVKYPLKTKSFEKVKSMLEMIAWFKYVLHMKSKQKDTNHECSLTAASELLVTGAAKSDNFSVIWSSWPQVGQLAVAEQNRHNAVIEFSSQAMFWTPSAQDKYQQLQVHFKKNKFITGVSLRGDQTHHKFVEEAEFSYNKIIKSQRVSQAERTVSFGGTLIRYLVLKPDIIKDAKYSFSMKLKARKNVPKAKTSYLERVWIVRKPRDCMCGSVARDSKVDLKSTNLLFSCSGKEKGEIVLGFETEVSELTIEFSNSTGYTALDVSLQSQNLCLAIYFKSPYCKEYRLPRPIVASNVALQKFKLKDCPIKYPPASISPTDGNIRLQFQLHGSPYDEPLEVDEKDNIKFQFNSLSFQKQYYYYLLCLEETGSIDLVNKNEQEQEAPMVQQVGGKSSFEPALTLVSVTIPEDYHPTAGHATDQYRVWVSQRPLDVRPFLQRGLHDSHTPLSYNVCSRVQKSQDIDEWYDHQFSVKIKKISTG